MTEERTTERLLGHLQADVENLKAGQQELRAGQQELRADNRRLLYTMISIGGAIVVGLLGLLGVLTTLVLRAT